MADRSVIVRLQAEISGFKKGMADATRAAQETASTASRGFTSTGSALGNLIQTSQQFPESWNKVAGVATKAGLAITAGVGLAVKAAMDWESAWTGVKKTVEGSPEQLARVEDGLRGLARSLPASHQQIAAVAEAAGQLGVKTDDVVAFTKTMIDMGESTNMSAEEAATGIARFTNVMGSVDKYGSAAFNKVASAIVGLGNNFATTEREILAMGQRLSAAGRSAGMTEGNVLGLAAAMSSVGIEAEAGGTAMTMVMNKIARSVDGGGSSLDAFAKRSGMSAQQFAEQWKKNPSQALNGLISGLGRAQGQGESMVQMLDELGIRGVREANTIRSLASASDLLGSALQRGNKDLDEGTAAIEEAGKRYSTTGSQVRMAWNAIKDGAIDVGAALLPAVQVITESVAGVAKTFSDLPDPVKGSIGVLGAFAGAGLLVVGGGMKLISSLAQTRAAFEALGISGAKAKGSLISIAKGAGIATAALIGLQALGSLIPDKASASSEDWARAILNVATGADTAATGLGNLVTRLDGLGRMSSSTMGGIDSLEKAIKHFTDGTNNATAGISDFFGGLIGSKSVLSQIKDNLQEMGKAMAGLVQGGHADAAAKSFDQLARAFEANEKSAVDALNSLPAYKDALLGLANAAGYSQISQEELADLARGKVPEGMRNAAKGAGEAGEAIAGMGGAATDAGESIGKLLEKMFAAGLATMSSRDATAKFHGSLRDVAKVAGDLAGAQGTLGAALNSTATDFDLTTEAGNKANSAFQQVVRDGIASVKAASEEGAGQDVLRQKLRETYEGAVRSAIQLGITGDAAQVLARKVLEVPDGIDVETWMDDTARRKAGSLKSAIDNVPKNVTITTRFVSLFEERGTPFRDDIDSAGRSRFLFGKAKGGHIGYLAGGGAISGPGTGTMDKAGLFALSNGEHVLTASDVNKLGGQRAVYSLRRDIQAGKINVAVNQPRYVPATAARMSGEFTGNLFLDSGEFLGKVRGITQAEISRNNRLLREPV